MVNKNENKKHSITIAIDGHSSCGKSTLAMDLARALEYVYVDTGAMYRAITLKILQKGISLQDSDAIDKILHGTDISFKKVKGYNRIHLDGRDVEDEIRTPEVASNVSPVAELSSVRKFLVDLQQKAGSDKAVVMEGRDIGTVVFPAAELKFFVTADLKTRTDRRYNELKTKGLEISWQEVEKNLSERDLIDSTREDSPLKMAADAILIDTTDHTRESQLELVLSMARKKIDSIS